MDIPVFKEYFKTLAADDRYLMVSYLGKCIRRKGHSLEKLVTLTTNNSKEKEKMMESIAQEYIDRGYAEGYPLGYEEGYALGYAEGYIVECAIQGIQQGVRQGLQHVIQQEKRAIAKNMLSCGLSVTLIGQVTGLSKQAIDKLSHG